MHKLTLRDQQLIILDILKYFDKICRKYNIKYTLCGGTLIGAIRHKGFIPWDDDIDVYMTREEYERFKKIWEKEKKEYYKLSTTEVWNKVTTGRCPQIFDTRYSLIDIADRKRYFFF